MAVATGTWRHGVHSAQRETHVIVIKTGGYGGPACGCVALVARRREVQHRMVRIRAVLEIRQVAVHARPVGDVVIAELLIMTIGTSTRRYGVLSGQHKAGAVVIECRVHPTGGVVALLACLREIRLNVIRLGRPLEILQVAGDAGCTVQCVVIADVAIGALARRHRVHSGQHEAGGGMVELAIRPLNGVVAGFACRREAVMRDRGSCAAEIFLVAPNAGQSAKGVIVVDVAVGALAGRNRVSSRENEAGAAVVEAGKIDAEPVVG